MIKDSLNDKELSKLNQDEFFLYVIIKTLEYLDLRKVPYSVIKKIYNKDISDDQIDNLIKTLVKKKIIKPDEFTLLREGDKWKNYY